MDRTKIRKRKKDQQEFPMNWMKSATALMIVLIIAGAARAADPAPIPSTAPAADSNAAVRQLHDDISPSLVAVKYNFESELGTQELVAAGVIVSSDGLVMIPIGIVTPAIVPDGQMKDFKIVLPSLTQDETEVDAVFEGRDERSSLAFVRAKTPQNWKAVQFVDVPLHVGDKLYAAGLLPKDSGYKTYVTQATVSADTLRGPVPQVLVDGNLTGVGSPVFNDRGQAVGYVHARSLSEALLDNPDGSDDIPMIARPPHMFIPASDFLQSLQDPPTEDKPVQMSWLGIAQMKGLDKEVAEFFGLTNKPAAQIGDIVKDSPADKAGLKVSDIIVEMNGQPLVRGDLPEEIPMILTREIQRMKPGATITLSIIRQKGDPPKDLDVTLAERPKQPYQAKRFYAKDLGFVVREIVFADAYRRKLPADTPGVVVALLRPEAAAQAAKLGANNLVTSLNGKPVTDLDEFKKNYEQFRKDKPKDAVVLVVSDLDGKEQTINIEPPQTDALPGGAGF
jgi:serine protease Do